MPSGERSSEARVGAEVAEFLSSSHAAGFSRARSAQVGEIARAFLEICYDVLATRPDLLDEEHLRDALLDHLPRRIDPKSVLAAQAPQVVRALLDHCYETRPNPSAWKFDPLYQQAEAEFPARLKEVGGTALAATPPDPLRRPGSKLGRNDPCPCGSGRKFKKCCGAGSP